MIRWTKEIHRPKPDGLALALAAVLSFGVNPMVRAEDAPIKTDRYTLRSETLASGLVSP